MNKIVIIIFSLLLFGLPTFAENYDADGMPKSQYEINIEQAEKMPPIKLSKRDLKKLETKGITKEAITLHVREERGYGKTDREIKRNLKRIIADIDRENRHKFFRKIISFFKRLFNKTPIL